MRWLRSMAYLLRIVRGQAHPVVFPRSLELPAKDELPRLNWWASKIDRPACGCGSCVVLLIALPVWLYVGPVLALTYLGHSDIGWSSGDVIFALLLLLLSFVSISYLRQKQKVDMRWVLDREELEPLSLSEATSYRVRLPAGERWDAARAGSLMERLLLAFKRLAFQIMADETGIEWRILDLRAGVDPQVMRDTILALYPSAEVLAEAVPREQFAPHYRHMSILKPWHLLKEWVSVFRLVDELRDFDPLTALTQQMSQLLPGERIVYTVYVADHAEFLRDQISRYLESQGDTRWLYSTKSWERIGRPLTAVEQEALRRFDASDQQLIVHKVTRHVFQGMIVFEVRTPAEGRIDALMPIANQLRGYENFPAGRFEPEASTTFVRTPAEAREASFYGRLSDWLSNRDKSWLRYRLLLDTREIAALWHLPNERFTAQGIHWGSRARVPMPAQLRNNRQGTRLGDNVYSGRSIAVYLRDEDRGEHMSIIGETGVGKSTFMHNMIDQDIRRGYGVAVIDPHGKLVRDVMRVSVPRERIKDVVLWDLADQDCPPPLNLLVVPKGAKHGEAAAYMQAVFEKVYPELRGTRMGSTFSVALWTLMGQERSTIRDVNRLFREPDYRHQVLWQMDDETSRGVEEFWMDYETKTPRAQDEMTEPIKWRIRELYSNGVLYPIMCHPVALPIHDLVNQNKIILVSLQPPRDESLPDGSRDLLGALWVSQLQMAIMAGAARRPFYAYIDEAQNFTTTALPRMLAEARKYNLSLILANQYLQQLEGSTLDAVLGVVGARVVFSCGPDDARRVAPYMRPNFTADDLTGLSKYEAAVSMRYQGTQLPAFLVSMRDMPDDLKNPRDDLLKRERIIREQSRRGHMPWKREQVMDWLAERYPRQAFGQAQDRGGDVTFFDPL